MGHVIVSMWPFFEIPALLFYRSFTDMMTVPYRASPGQASISIFPLYNMEQYISYNNQTNQYSQY